MLVYLGTTAADDVILYEKEADPALFPRCAGAGDGGGLCHEAIEEKSLDLDTVQGTYTLEMFNSTIAGTRLGNCNMAFGETWTLRGSADRLHGHDSRRRCPDHGRGRRGQ